MLPIDEQGFRYRAETHTAAARARVERVAAEVAERRRVAADRADRLVEYHREPELLPPVHRPARYEVDDEMPDSWLR
ncbi:MAG: hypothetical protein ACRDRZ_18610 [Pseudonocardiaceae bacterium]